MKGVLDAPTESGRISQRGRTERLKGRRSRDISFRHEGLAPVRLPRLENRIELFSGGAFLPDSLNDRLGFSPVLGVMV
jgi:hypothetical protein